MNKPSPLPSVEQLATLAALAALAGPRDETPQRLAARALAIWRASQAALAIESARPRGRALVVAAFMEDPLIKPAIARIARARAAIRRPKRFPFPARELAAYAVPRLSGRSGEAADATRRWLRWRACRDRWEETGQPEALHAPFNKEASDAMVTEWRNRELTAAEFDDFANDFAAWHARTSKDEISAARRRAANIRHGKK